MATISQPRLSVDQVPGHPGRRRLHVSYELICEAGDPVVGRTILEYIVVRAVDEHDAAARPRQTSILETGDTFVTEVGTHPRHVEGEVNRVDLDVEEDWWSADQGGAPSPIAEWLDHLAADIQLEVSGESVGEATTPTVTGSWGALGDS